MRARPRERGWGSGAGGVPEGASDKPSTPTPPRTYCWAGAAAKTARDGPCCPPSTIPGSAPVSLWPPNPKPLPKTTSGCEFIQPLTPFGLPIPDCLATILELGRIIEEARVDRPDRAAQGFGQVLAFEPARVVGLLFQLTQGATKDDPYDLSVDELNFVQS